MNNDFNNRKINLIQPGLGLGRYLFYGFINKRSPKLLFIILLMFISISLKISIFFGFILTSFSLFGFVSHLVFLFLLEKNKMMPIELLSQKKSKRGRINIFRDGPHILHLRLGRFKYFRFCYEDSKKLNEIEAYIFSKLRD